MTADAFGSANGLRQMASGKWPAATAVGRSEREEESTIPVLILRHPVVPTDGVHLPEALCRSEAPAVISLLRTWRPRASATANGARGHPDLARIHALRLVRTSMCIACPPPHLYILYISLRQMVADKRPADHAVGRSTADALDRHKGLRQMASGSPPAAATARGRSELAPFF